MSALPSSPLRSQRLPLLGLALLAALAGCQQKAPPAPPAAPNTRPAGVSRFTSELAPDRLLVKLAPATSSRSRAVAGDGDLLGRIRQVAGVKATRPAFAGSQAPVAARLVQGPGGVVVPLPDLTRWHRIDLEPGADVAAKLKELQALPGVAAAEPDYLRRPSALPNNGSDPLLGQQWHLDAVHAREAWTYLQGLGLPPGGARDVVVAVIDTGIDLSHPDLAANLWTGADGAHGFDAITGGSVPLDDHGHGTHVAGIIASQAGNHLGGVGVAYNVQLMAIKAAQYSGVLASSDVARGIQYAVEHGADVINMSFGGYGRSQIEEDALTVAFGQAVLVAAAGNDAAHNDLRCGSGARLMYPAGYNWVLGVMASASTPNGKGDLLAPFSNWDCVPADAKEYELMAPGAAIMSTLPGGQYAAWSGTSMATPVVSGIAALLRTRFPDKDLYPSRFIMGQLAVTGPVQQGITVDDQVHAFHAADALAALTTLPTPALSYLDHWLFDATAIAAGNVANGVVDAGETIDLAVTIRNQWGKADGVTVRLEPIAAGAVGPDPYVTMVTDTVSYGAVGSFASDDNGLVRDASGAVTGVANPFRFTVSPTTPNAHVIPFKVTMTARNGYDPADATSYVAEGRFTVTVTSGRELPQLISTDTTLAADTLWVVNRPVLVDTGATLTVAPGAKVLFTFKKGDAAYQQIDVPSIQVNGTMRVQGTEALPVEMWADRSTGCVTPAGITGIVCPGVRIKNRGTTTISYARIADPLVGYESAACSNYPGFNAWVTAIDHAAFEFEDVGCGSHWAIGADSLATARLSKLNSGWTNLLVATTVSTTQFDAVRAGGGAGGQDVRGLQDSVYLSKLDMTLQGSLGAFRNNAFLNPYLGVDAGKWMILRSQWEVLCDGTLPPRDLTSNYWGTANTGWIDTVIHDFYDNFSCPKISYQPILTTPAETTYPFAVDVAVSNGAGQRVAVVGNERATFTVTFSRDMDTSAQPQVSFGPATPYTDYLVGGAWQDARTWVGSHAITPLTGDGYQYLRVAGARAASDHWLVTGEDVGRFRFEVLTSGAESMNLQATGAEGRVELTWTQTDFDLLAGYHLYRSTTAGGTYVRINQSIIPPQQKAYTDAAVAPGQRYFYRFTVVKTDMTESDFSNVATATPLDTVPPVIGHAPVTGSAAGQPLTLTAQVTDNVAVQSADLWFRALGAPGFTRRSLVNVTGATYAATLEGSLVAAPGLEYYLTASDGITTVNFGRPEYPYQVVVADRPVVNVVTPAVGPSGGGTTITVAGSNFKPGATVTLGGAACDAVVVLTSSQIACTTAAHFPASADVVVVNPGGESGVLLHGFTFQSDVASLSLPSSSAQQHAVLQVPVAAAAIAGLVSADLTLTFDPAVISVLSASTGSLTAGWSLVANPGTAGQVRLSMASQGGAVAGGGTLAVLEVELLGAPGASSPLAFSAVQLNGGAIPASTADGAVAVQAVCSAAGAIRAWSGGAPVPGVQLLLSGDRLYAATSGLDGGYSVTGVPPGAYTLRPSKSDDAGGITGFDASLVLRHAAGLSALTGPAAQAADVDKSGAIDALDAFYVLQAAAGLIAPPFPGAGVTWEFTPASRSYAGLATDLTGQDFTALLLGDVSGNWTSSLLQGGAALGLQVSEAPPATDGTILAAVAAAPAGQQVYSLDVVLEYDAARGTPEAVAPDLGAPGWLLSANTSRPGEVRVALAGAAPLSADGAAFALRFATAADAQDVVLRIRSVAVNESLGADVQYRLTLEHARVAARIAAGALAPSAAQRAKYDLGPLVAGAPRPDGAIDVEDVVMALRSAAGLAP